MCPFGTDTCINRNTTMMIEKPVVVVTSCVLSAAPMLCCSMQKGPMHFTEPCPESFTMEEWTTLTQEDLPAITKLIGRPTPNASGQKMLVSKTNKRWKNKITNSSSPVVVAFMAWMDI